MATKSAAAKLHRTKIDLPEPARAKLVDLLNGHLANAIDLVYQAKQAHWNVKGMQFISLHELFDGVSSMAAEHADELAERCATLGGTPEGTVRVAGGRSKLDEYPLRIVEGRHHLDALSSAVAAYAEHLRKAIDETAALRDLVTSDLFTELAGEADKKLWLLEAHFQGVKA